MLLLADILCPDKNNFFDNISTVAEQISQLSRHDSAQVFTSNSVVFDESTDKTNNPQLPIFIRGSDDQFKVTEEFVFHAKQTIYVSKNVQKPLSHSI